MTDSTSVTDVIIWASPLVGGLAAYLAHEALTSIKEDIKELRDRQVKTREDIADVKADVKISNDSLGIVARNVEASNTIVSQIDRRSGDTREMAMFMRAIEGKMSEHEANYGKVILILKKVVTILRPKASQESQE